MKNKMYVFKTALIACLGSVVAASSVMVAPTVGVNAAALTNGPIYFSTTTGVGAINTDGTTATVPTFIKGAPSYSTDGDLVTWVEAAGPLYNLMIAKSDGTDKKILATTPSGFSFYKPQFTSDNQKIVFFDKDSGSSTRILEVDTTTANQTPTVLVAAGSQASYIRDMSISASGDIAFTANACGRPGVYVRRADGTYTNGTSALANTCDAGSMKQSTGVLWNAAGTGLFVLRVDFTSGTTGIYSADPVTGISATPTALVSMGTFADRFALSPDGTKFVYSENSPSKFEISVSNIDGANKVGPWTVTGQGGMLSWGIPVADSGGGSTPSSDGTDSTPSSGGSDSSSTDSGDTPTNTGSTTSASPVTNVVPGVTVTDTKIYTQAPKKVASSSAVAVLTPEQIKTQRIVSNTPSVCVPTKDDIVFIDEGRCSALILSKKSGKVLRQFRTTVVEDEVSELKVGNEVAVIAPIYFDAESTDVNSRGMRRIRGLAPRISAAGEVLVVGHSGIALGDTLENRRLSRARAISTVKAMKKVGATGPFVAVGVGTKSPAVSSTKGKDQAKNRRTVIILVP